EWSKKLYDEKYISKTELKRDELAASKANLDCEIARSDANLLKDFTYKRELAQLESDVKQAIMALERTNRKAKADIIQAKAKLRAKESEFKRQQDKLQKVEEQITKTKIYAPADGLVIYATSANIGGFRHFNQEPLEEGQEVREREELFYLPTASAMKAAVKIHESSMKKVDLGLPARITIDALPSKVFSGNVIQIAPLPDAVSMWLNPDLKVYSAEIHIDSNDSELRTGMSCKVEIIIEEYKDVIYIPVQAIVRIKGRPTVYVVADKTTEPREVQIGLDNNRMVRIISGLKPGESVLLNPPLAAGTVEESADITATETAPGVEQKRLREELPEGKTDKKPKQGDRKKREKISPEERGKIRKRFENMSPEEREKILQQQTNKRQQGTEGK
ncbi:MAG: efflux RND transporter periplasmic adaptor subunit, partial [Planctomycetota bacterium]